MLIRYIYTFFLGLLLVIFIGMGVSVFYVSPKMPEAPDVIKYGYDFDKASEEVKQQQRDYDKKVEDFDKNQMSNYNRNVSMIVMAFAVGLLVVGLVYDEKIKMLADGILLGGVFTLLYSLGRGIATSDSKYRFSVVTVGLLITLGLGYMKFIKPHEQEAKQK